MIIDERIIKFLKRHHVLNLATVSQEGVPYCAACFYAYDASHNRLIFTSDDSTHHAQEMAQNPKVACAITLETRIVGKVQGAQICGIAERGNEEDRAQYIKRFPYAAVAPLTIWAIVPTFIKLTDNTLGFGKKLIWNSQE